VSCTHYKGLRLCTVCNAQDGKLLLHLALEKCAMLEVVVLLLAANPKATYMPTPKRPKDEARPPYICAAYMRPLRPVALRVYRGRRAPSINFASSCAAQAGGLLPLHLAIMQGASEELVAPLLDANSEATATPDEARTRNLRRRPRAHETLIERAS